jgi:hypothetical protein
LALVGKKLEEAAMRVSGLEKIKEAFRKRGYIISE